MPGNFMKEDLRIIKTYNALMDAMATLLERRNFNQITVNDICEAAQISRTTFYTYFNDKYDLLKNWLTHSKAGFYVGEEPSQQIMAMIDTFTVEKTKITKNLIDNANGETIDLLHTFMISLLGEASAETDSPLCHQVFSIFFAGGTVNYLSWHVKHKTPDLQEMNNCFNDFMCSILRIRTDPPKGEVSNHG